MMGDGLHLIVDGLMRKPLSLEDIDGFLLGCALVIDMTVIDGPTVYDHGDHLTGVIVIAQSDIIIHIKGRAVCLDIFSCMTFDEKLALRYAERFLDLVSFHAQRIQRGWDNGSPDNR